MSKETTRRRFLTGAGAGAVATIAGCSSGPTTSKETTSNAGDGGNGGNGGDGGDGGDDTQSTTSEPSGPAGTLRMMATGSIQTLDPINAKGSGAGYDQYGRSLMEFENGLYPPKAALAESYEMSDDGLTYTFKLKEGVTFHDGSELTASDVVYSYRRLAGSENSRNRDDIVGDTMTIEHEKDASRTDPTDEKTLSDYVPGSLAVEAVDEYTFEFTLRSPFQYTLFQIAGGAFSVLPEGAVGDVQGYDGQYSYNEFFSTANGGPKYAGLGPFTVDSWTKGSEIRLSAYDDYYGSTPSLDEVVYTVVGSGNTRVNRFKNGNADVLEDMPTASFDPDKVSIETEKGSRSIGTYAFQDGTTVNYGEIPALETEYLVFNTTKVPRAVRKAFAFAMNQHDIAENVYKGNAKPAYHITPPDPYPTFEDGTTSLNTYDKHAKSGYQSNLDLASDGYPYGYDETRLDDAKRVMEAAGYGENNRFSITATTIAGSSAYASVLTRLQSKLRAAYVDMEIVEAEFGTIISKAISGKMDVFALGDGMEYPGPQNFLRFLWGGSPESQFTRWGAKGEGKYFDADLRQKTIDAWKNKYAADGATEASKAEAFQTVEEGNWGAVQELPIVHPTSQRFWHDDVEMTMFGVMENQTFTDVTLNR